MSRFKYVFPATFDYEEKGIAVSFPDLPGCVTCGDTGEQALAMAKEALGGYLAIAEEEGDPIPSPSDLSAIPLAPKQRTVLVEVSMLDVRVEIRNRPVKKTLTIPAWLNEEAEKNKVNFSHLLQDALKTHLGLSDRQGNR